MLPRLTLSFPVDNPFETHPLRGESPAVVGTMSARCRHPLATDLAEDIRRIASKLHAAGNPKQRAWNIAISKCYDELKRLAPNAWRLGNEVFGYVGLTDSGNFDLRFRTPRVESEEVATDTLINDGGQLKDPDLC